VKYGVDLTYCFNLLIQPVIETPVPFFISLETAFKNLTLAYPVPPHSLAGLPAGRVTWGSLNVQPGLSLWSTYSDPGSLFFAGCPDLARVIGLRREIKITSFTIYISHPDILMFCASEEGF
jgi:hypothetical protein